MVQPPDENHFQTARQILQTLCEAGYDSYFAGGCVRDHCMGLSPKDYDIATAARPAQVEQLFDRTVSVGAAFGVMLVLQGDYQFEVATFRQDGPYLDGRHPESVTFSSPRDDAERRDFTINGMMWNPETDEILDWVGGRDDIDNKIIRAIGDPSKRFEEDKLRILRAIRFSARFKFPIEDKTRQQLMAQVQGLSSISAERIREELEKLIVHPSRSNAFAMMHETGVLQEILPEMAAMPGVEQPPQYHPEGDVWVHTLLVLDHLGDTPSVELAFAALLHDVGKPPTFKRAKDRIRFDGHQEVSVKMSDVILRRLRFSNQKIEHIQALVGNHMQFMQVKNMRVSTLKRFMSLHRFEEHLDLNRADCMGATGNLESYHFVQEHYKEYRSELEDNANRPKPLLSGHDLITLGFKPGPHFQEILRAVEDEQLELRLQTHDQALQWVQEKYKDEG